MPGPVSRNLQFNCAAESDGAALGCHRLANRDNDAASIGKLDRVDREVEQYRFDWPAPPAKNSGCGFEMESDFQAFTLLAAFERRGKLANQIVQSDFLFFCRLSHRVRERKVHHVFDR